MPTPCSEDTGPRAAAGLASGRTLRLVSALDYTTVWSRSISINGVTFLGPVSATDLRVLYQNAEALVYPSLYEGFGLPPLEAMAAGTPVIAMPFSSVPDVCGDACFMPMDFSDHFLRGRYGASCDRRLASIRAA